MTMRRWLLWSWVGVVGPIVGSEAIGGISGLLPHPIYHPVYVILSLGALYAAVRLRSASTGRVPRALATTLVAVLITHILGQTGQEIAVFLHGGFHAGEHIFMEPFHLANAILSAASIGLALITLTTLSVYALSTAIRADKTV
ncbi:hypothetical protein GPX89_23465 [Nocardia sp. ET3-3]|uniref:Uncharacterized protein n=1 Tax=Nocardia terrae TaxID=2675851 RepID=A0A7K1V0Y3_9NOCA|nr:hypothetical protein [Nocardia terrae]MVU80191.1 hypothetical protein [Nocardia terrae]